MFINPDLTKGEAKQAYERRQHRRQTSSNASGIGVDGAGQSMMEGRSVATGLTSSITFVNSQRSRKPALETTPVLNTTSGVSSATPSSVVVLPVAGDSTTYNYNSLAFPPISISSVAHPVAIISKLNVDAMEYRVNEPVSNAVPIVTTNSAIGSSQSNQ